MSRPKEKITNTTNIGKVVGPVNSGSGDLIVTIPPTPPSAKSESPIGSFDASKTRDQRMLFVSYCHHDIEWLRRLQVALKPLVRSETLILWDDTRIKPGDKWRDAIRMALDSASAAVFLVTQNFLASDFIVERELPALLKASEERGVRILWIAVGAALYEESPLWSYQCINDPNHPLETLPRARRNVQLVRAAEKIRDTLRS